MITSRVLCVCRFLLCGEDTNVDHIEGGVTVTSTSRERHSSTSSATTPFLSSSIGSNTSGHSWLEHTAACRALQVRIRAVASQSFNFSTALFRIMRILVKYHFHEIRLKSKLTLKNKLT